LRLKGKPPGTAVPGGFFCWGKEGAEEEGFLTCAFGAGYFHFFHAKSAKIAKGAKEEGRGKEKKLLYASIAC